MRIEGSPATIAVMRFRTPLLALFAVILLAAPLSACGGDDDSGSNSSPGSDEQYVKTICKAASQFGKDIDKKMSGPTPDNFEDIFSLLFKAIVEPLQDFAKAFKKAQPPADLVDWHRTASKQLDDAAKAAKAGNFDDPALEGLSNSPIPSLPAGAEERLRKVAENTPECKDANVFDAASG